MSDAVQGSTVRVLVAADKFKGSLTAVEVAAHVTAGLRAAVPGVTVESLPVADGGDGTVDAAVAGGFERRTAQVTGPLGRPVEAAYAFRDGTAVVEMAEASGLRHLPPGVFAPLTATTYGTGELLRAALDAGARTIVLGVGGSASTDGGAGMLSALGARLLDADGRARSRPAAPRSPRWPRRTCPGSTRGWPRPRSSSPATSTTRCAAPRARRRSTGRRRAPPSRTWTSWTPRSALRRGARGVRRGSAALRRRGSARRRGRRRDRVRGPGRPAAPPSGPGSRCCSTSSGFADALARADLVITGEGSLDAQSLHGKAPVGVASAARRRGIPVAAVCGRLTLSAAELDAAGIARAYALSELEPDLARCIAEAGPLLERTAAALARDFLS